MFAIIIHDFMLFHLTSDLINDFQFNAFDQTESFKLLNWDFYIIFLFIELFEVLDFFVKLVNPDIDFIYNFLWIIG